MIGKIQVRDTLTVEWGVIEIGHPSEIGPYILIERENDVAFVNLDISEVPDLVRALLKALESLDARAAEGLLEIGDNSIGGPGVPAGD